MKSFFVWIVVPFDGNDIKNNSTDQKSNILHCPKMHLENLKMENLFILNVPNGKRKCLPDWNRIFFIYM